MTTIPCTRQQLKTVKVCYLLLITASLTLSGCESARQKDENGGNTINAHKLPALEADRANVKAVPYSLPATRTDLSRFHMPPTLAGLKLDGEISSDNARTFRYVSESRRESLQVILSNLPAGWDTMDPKRAVASYYGEARQRRVQKALSNPANALSILSENLMDLEGEPAAQAQMRWIEPNHPIQNQSVLITLIDGSFIRISNASYQQNTRWLLQQAKRSLAEIKAAQE
ncbi:hypothetical protein GFN93_13870 [Alcanivorax sp. PA15-N-34]|uniref:ABC-type transport auxiliary lipoprotein component domain-containing protein n=1 Tax=Alcanivorax sediminis TaxID=2663008 RepID=A0A6N7LV35_9GAMM|nr:hypothetical protein [Alcanivorax sediminis]